jgi:hypothetical protein
MPRPGGATYDRVRQEAATMVMSLNKVIRKTGYAIARAEPAYPPDFDETDVELIERVQPFTMTSPERIVGLAQAVRYVVAAGTPGAFVECGVWRGGSMMAMALTLRALGDMSHDLYLFDTFEGMSPPTEADVAIHGQRAADALRTGDEDDEIHARAGIDDVRRNVLSTGYDAGRIHFVRGMVEQTVPASAPKRIALLRLDTDWYESTRHELEQLYPRLAPGGVLIIDDYGHWQGARRAVDEYFAENGIHILLNRLDYTGRIAVKP